MVTAAYAFGLLVGSFLNVCIHRWPTGESVVAPRSRCTHCDTKIAWYDNIPLLSFALLRGRCRTCGTPISLRYPFVELLTGVTFATLVASGGLNAATYKNAIFASMLIVLFFTDLEHFLLPDQVTIGGLAIGIGFSVLVPLQPGLATVLYFLAGIHPEQWVVSLTESILGAVLFGGTLLTISEAFFRLRGIEGLGFGDVKLAAMIAAFLGTAESVLVVLIGCLLAMVGGVAGVMLRGKSWRSPLPLGSYLSVAAYGSLLAGNAILVRYWDLFVA